ncbi:hypothetical protein ACTNEO_03495 [Gracilibacillus sp. HCP3S3_G5_1]
MGAIVQVDKFTKKYGKLTAISPLSFRVKKGSVFALLGPNGWLNLF